MKTWSNTDMIVAVLRRADRPLTFREIARAIGGDPVGISKDLDYAQAQGRVATSLRGGEPAYACVVRS